MAAERPSSEEVFALRKWRIVFSKTGMGKYISHLDLLRCFTRTIQRSGLPVVYSQGFNPHQKMTFALPLPIGVTSQCETVDIQFEDGVEAPEIMEALNRNLPMDIKVLAVHSPKSKASDITAAMYRMEAATSSMVTRQKLREFFGEGEILVSKKTKKKGEKTVNLLDYVRSWEVTGTAENGFCLRVVLAAGGEQNLKPEILGKAIADFVAPVEITDWDMHRMQIFCRTEDGLQTVFV